jgi:hypothetical protein
VVSEILLPKPGGMCIAIIWLNQKVGREQDELKR